VSIPIEAASSLPVVSLVGVGLDGASYRAVSSSGELELWRLHPQALDERRRRGLRALAEARHPHLVPLLELALDAPQPWIWLGAGGLRWGDPSIAIGPVRERLHALASALAVAHALDVVHGALGLDCVALDPMGRVLLDLTGLSVRPSASRPRAPELVHAPPSAAADVWALGTMFAGGAPELDALLAAMRADDPERRPTALDVVRALDPTPRPSAPKEPGFFGIPRRLGAYELIEPIGAGGMGRVFRARDVAGGPDVAIKVLLPSWADDAEVVARFRREARILAALESPHVVRFLGANQDQSFHYLVMELVRATSLERLLEDGKRLDVELAVRVTCDVARALGEVHALALVHRDVKPANVLVDTATSPVTVKLCDFGIARSTAPDAEKLTRAGTVGTPSFMAPEQIEERPLDARTDVYALAATAYCMLTGRPPFVGTAHQVMIAHLTQEPTPLGELEPSIPPAVARVIEGALAKSPAARPADAAAFLESLETAWRGATATVTALPQPIGLTGSPRVYEFRWSLRAEPEELWPHVSNTERLNRAAGLDDVEWSHAPGEGYVETQGSFRAAGMQLRWKENPFEWVAPSRLGVVREYLAGPFHWLRSTVTLDGRAGGGTDLCHRVELLPRGVLGVVAASVEVGIRLRRGFDRVYTRIDEACMVARAHGALRDDPFEAPQRASDKLRARIDERLARAIARGADPHVLEALATLVATAPGPRLARIRPRELAREHGFDDDATLSAMLLASAEGVLELMWDILCPSCRIPSGIEESLRNLEEHGRCEVCDLDFELDMARSIELVFRAHPSLRAADLGVYCIGGPAHSPHVLAQVRLAPGERFALEVPLAPGRYGVAGRGLPRRWSFAVSEHAPLDSWELPLRAGASADVPRSLRAGLPRIVLTNDLGHEALVRVERDSARDDAVTAADAAANAMFRALFPEQVLSPERMVAVSDVAFVLAKVANALTRYEREEAEVHRALVALTEDVRRAAEAEGGSLVELSGDGALAVFSDRVAAVRAALALSVPVGVGVGVHAGAARMTSVGGRLGYFGKTRHLSEQLAASAQPGELLVSEALFADPALAPLLLGECDVLGYARVGATLGARLRRRMARAAAA
jgi:serine/threonine protein kinase